MLDDYELDDIALDILSDLHKKYPIFQKNTIKDKIVPEINQWKRHVIAELINKKFETQLILLAEAEKELKAGRNTLGLLEADYLTYKSFSNTVKIKIDNNYWERGIEKLKNIPKFDALFDKYNKNNIKISSNDNRRKEDILIFRTNLHKQWRKLLDEQYANWEFKKINELRSELLKKLTEWLMLMQELDDVLSKLNLGHGLFFDLSEGNLTLTDIEKIKKWVEYISQDNGVKELCDLMGRLRRSEKNTRKELVKRTSIVHEYVPDTDSKEEIVGITLGRDIEHVIPQELALLSDDETSILFDMKYIEGRLMCFDMEGFKENKLEVNEEIMIDVDIDEQLGPIIICVDTSGSMSGTPESIAKAITLFMATRAISQKRACYLINFSTSIETLDLSGGVGITKVIDFLKRSFHGGTDASQALEYALELMTSEGYKKSDLLVISDFIMGSLPESLYTKITASKENSNKFFSLSIGDMFLNKRLKSLFDDEWVFNPSSSSIQSLHKTLVTI